VKALIAWIGGYIAQLRTDAEGHRERRAEDVDVLPTVDMSKVTVRRPALIGDDIKSKKITPSEYRLKDMLSGLNDYAFAPVDLNWTEYISIRTSINCALLKFSHGNHKGNLYFAIRLPGDCRDIASNLKLAQAIIEIKEQLPKYAGTGI
jgi:hypothetical protein